MANLTIYPLEIICLYSFCRFLPSFFQALKLFAFVVSSGGCSFCQKDRLTSIIELTPEEFKNENEDPIILESLFFEFDTRADRDAFKKNCANLRNFHKGNSFEKKDLQDFLEIYPELLYIISASIPV